MDRYFFGLAVAGAFWLWLLASLPPLVGGLVMLARSPRTGGWPREVIQLVATLTLKPVVTGAIYLALYLILYLDAVPLRALPVLAVLGPGATALILWRFRDAMRTLPRLALATLLGLDLLRWVSAFLATMLLLYPLVALLMPTFFMIVAWLLVATGGAELRPRATSAPDDQPEPGKGAGLISRPRASRRLWTVLVVAVVGALAVLTLPWTLNAVIGTSRQLRSAGQALHSLDGRAIFSLTWSPDGAFIAAAGESGDVYVVYAAQDKLQFTYDTPAARIDHVAWSPQGDVIAVRLPNAIQLIDAQDGTELRAFPILSSSVGAVWSPDGRWLAVDAGPQGAVILDPLDVQSDRTFVRDGSIVMLAWSPDGGRLAVAESSDGANVAIWDAATGALLGRLTTGVDQPQVAWSPDGAWLGVHGWYDQGVQLYDAATLQPQAQPIDQLDELAYTAWSPDGALLALEHTDGTIAIWEPAGAAPLQRFPDAVDQATLSQLAWSHDGRWLAAEDIAGVWVWDNLSGTQQSLALPGRGAVSAPVWHPTQPAFVVSSASGVRLVTLEP